MITNSDDRPLRRLTRDWFLFLCAYRRNVARMPSDTAWVRTQLKTKLTAMREATAPDAALRHLLGQAVYPLVYFADEVLLNCRWSGESAWARQLLEGDEFNTQHAGKDFFDRLQDPGLQDRDLLEVYYLCLALGFRGALARKPLQLREAKELLAARLGITATLGPRFCREAYDHTETRDFVRLPVVAAARIALIAALVVICVHAGSAWLIQSTSHAAAEAASNPSKK